MRSPDLLILFLDGYRN